MWLSPLSFSGSPLFFNVFNDAGAFLQTNGLSVEGVMQEQSPGAASPVRKDGASDNLLPQPKVDDRREETRQWW